MSDADQRRMIQDALISRLTLTGREMLIHDRPSATASRLASRRRPGADAPRSAPAGEHDLRKDRGAGVVPPIATPARVTRANQIVEAGAGDRAHEAVLIAAGHPDRASPDSITPGLCPASKLTLQRVSRARLFHISTELRRHREALTTAAGLATTAFRPPA